MRASDTMAFSAALRKEVRQKDIGKKTEGFAANSSVTNMKFNIKPAGPGMRAESDPNSWLNGAGFVNPTASDSGVLKGVLRGLE
jgi:hypothetical protein